MRTLSKKLLADTLIAKRKEKHLTQNQVAEATGINRAMIGRAENMEYVPSIDQLEKLGKELDFEVIDLFVDDRQDTPNSTTVDKKYNIAVAGTGYVGLSIAILLDQHNHVTAVDILPDKVDLINNRKSPIQDDYIERYLAEKELDLTASLDGKPLIRLLFHYHRNSYEL
jgi:UDPglucose 6-dehydrogenase